MYILGFNLLPAIIFLPIAYLCFFVFFLTRKINMKAKVVLSGLFSGFFGFFFTVAIPLNEDYYHIYLLTPISFFILFLVFTILTCFFNINPFSPNNKLFFPKPKKEFIPKAITTFEQDKNESYHLTHLLLNRLPEPFKVIKAKKILNGDEEIFFPYILINQKGVFPIFPCNWSGKIALRNNQLVRYNKSKLDIHTNSVYDPFKEKILTSLFEDSSFKYIPIHKIVLATNPTAYLAEPLINEDFSLVDLGEFIDFIDKFDSNKNLSESDIQGIKSFLEQL